MVNSRTDRAVLLVILLALDWFLFSRLSFVPVPWPDGAAFFLPSIDLFRWPPEWLMRSQAAFIPSYNSANFNMMPGLPLLFGLLTKLGFIGWLPAAFAIRAVSASAFGVWVWGIWRWVRTSRAGAVAGIAIAGAALWDPILRWGTWVVRSEAWVGLIWLFLIRELSARRRPWRVAGLLAAAAYVHFEAIWLLPPTIAYYLLSGIGIAALCSVAWRALVFLSPWLIYVFSHFDLFRSQMQTQFGRLSHANPWIHGVHSLFHGLFLESGSPEGMPKFFNLAKGFFWVLVLAMTADWLVRIVRRALWRENSVVIAAGVAFFTTFYLWGTKDEFWFITSIHMALWVWVASYFVVDSRSFLKRSPAILSVAFAVLAVGATFSQWAKMPDNYTWSGYKKWIDCIERSIPPSVDARQPKIWQPHVPDALVELASRAPERDLTRALDFPSQRARAEEFGAREADMIIFSNFLRGSDARDSTDYEGPAGARDFKRMESESELPFGEWGLRELSHSPSWLFKACENGPFWASIAVRRR